jgi:hypothetical protein
MATLGGRRFMVRLGFGSRSESRFVQPWFAEIIGRKEISGREAETRPGFGGGKLAGNKKSLSRLCSE